MIDRVLQEVNVPKSRLQLLGITSLWIASKYEETYNVPKITDIVYVCDNAYNKEDVLEMEGFIL